MPLNLGKFDADRWQLFHVDEDRSEARDLADEQPEKLEELTALWLEEAMRYDVLPLNDLGSSSSAPSSIVIAVPESGQYTYYPGTSVIPEALGGRDVQRVRTRSSPRSSSRAQSQGVIVAHGSRFGGYTLFVKDGKLTYVYNFLGIPPEQRIAADAPTSGTHIVGIEFTKERSASTTSRFGTLKLYVDDEVVAEHEIRTIASRYSLCGEGLCIGYDSGDAVSGEYTPRFEFTGGTIVKVVFDVADDAYVDVERHLAAALARDSVPDILPPGTTRRHGRRSSSSSRPRRRFRPRSESLSSTTTARSGARSRCRSSSSSS